MENPYRQFDEDFSEPERTHQVHFQTNNTIIPPAVAVQDGKHVRLRAVETESEYFLKAMNVTSLRWLALIQIGASLAIFISQIILYGLPTGRYNNFKFVDYTGIGIWGPILFFAAAAGLTWMATKGPSGCSIGTAMGFQVASSIFASLLLFLAVISLMQHGRYSYNDDAYDPEVAGRIFCSFMILGAGAVIIASIFASIHFCRSVCCGRQRIMENMMFDVVTVK